MNQDQLVNLIQTIGKLVGAALVTHGVGDSGVWESVTGTAVAVGSWYWSHRSNATPPKKPGA